jgi:hypothetical protein
MPGMKETEKQLREEIAQLRLVLAHAKAELCAASWPDYYPDYDDDRLMDEIDALGIESIALPEVPPAESTPEEIEDRERANAMWVAPAGIVYGLTREQIVTDGLGELKQE